MLNQLLMEADTAYRRDRITTEFDRSRQAHRRARSGRLRRVIDAIRGDSDPRHGAARLDPDGSLISAGLGFNRDPRAVGAPHHATTTS